MAARNQIARIIGIHIGREAAAGCQLPANYNPGWHNHPVWNLDSFDFARSGITLPRKGRDGIFEYFTFLEIITGRHILTGQAFYASGADLRRGNNDKAVLNI
jgi:hypothetical protein